MPVNVLCIGDVVGRPGRMVLADQLGAFIKERSVDLVVCNAENAAGGSGLTPQIFEKLQRYGVDAVTMGDHVYRRKEIIPLLEKSDRIVRPANLSVQAAGRRWTVVPIKSGQYRAGVACVLGQMYMGANDSPWAAVDRCMDEMGSEIRIRVVDFHAEASSEKIAMGWHLDGRASIVFGTHTHIPTADARVLPGGTAFISDVGMTGPYEGVLGRRKDRVLSSLRTNMPAPYDVTAGDPRMCGVLASIDPMTGKALSVERIEVQGKTSEGGAYDEDDANPSQRRHGR
ncbi:MAG: YmdB family metallophosphoesterase [Planctomycetaceae bacterium]|nr:YmdB family metallophosphoesterase [Planctomycetaceae bacterium]